MQYHWLSFKNSISAFFYNSGKAIRRIWWITMACVLVVSVTVAAYVNIQTDGLTFMSNISELAAESRPLLVAANQEHRERGRLGDFSYLFGQLGDNYPFIEMADRAGADVWTLAVEAFEELEEVARYDVSSNFFLNFINDNFLSGIGNFGNLRLTSEARQLAAWVVQPYFFGFYDWRFYDDRFHVTTAERNFATEILTEDVAYLQIYSFLDKGYYALVRPVRHFYFETEQQQLLDFFAEIYDFEHLIIDIRGRADGFGEYFLPLILQPNLTQEVQARFYAFHMDGDFAHSVSSAFRAWHNLGGLQPAAALAQNLPYIQTDDLEQLTHGFPIDISARISARPTAGAPAFGGNIWLLTDTDNFSGPNQMYLQLARQAGFNIIYESNPQSVGWATSFVRLPHSGLSLRYNPLYFTDSLGRALEEFPLVPDHILPHGVQNPEDVLSIVID